MATPDTNDALAVSHVEPILRPALNRDADAIDDLVRWAYEPYAPLIGRTPIPMLTDHAVAVRDREVFVLVVDDQVIGVLDMEPRVDHLWLENVAVHPDHQRRGLGRTLLAHAETVGRQHGLAEIRLLTNERYVDNIAMYRRYGYHETHRRPYLGTDLVYFSKSIATDPRSESRRYP